jgi:YVTN family beta-propeller protein
VGETVAIGERIFVSDPTGNRLVAADEGGHVGRVTGMFGALGLTTDGRYLYVALSTSTAVVVLDPSTLKEVARVSTSPCRPLWLAHTGGRVWVSQSCDSVARLGSFGTSERVLVDAGSVPWLSPVHLAASPAYPDALFGGTLGVSPTTIYRAEIVGTSVVGTHDTRDHGSNLGDLHVAPDGDRLLLAAGAPYVITSLNVADLTSAGTYSTGPYPLAVTATTDGDAIIGGINGTYSDDVFVFDAATGQSIRSARVDGRLATRGLAVLADGTLFAVTEPVEGSSTLHVFRDVALLPGTIDARMTPDQPQEREIVEVAGIVRDTRGRAVANGRVEVTEVDSEGRDPVTVTTDASGAFTSLWYIDQSYASSVTFEVSWAGDGVRTGLTVARLQFTVGSRTRHRALRVDVSGGAVQRAIEISRWRFADGIAAAVVLGRDDLFADSLAGTPLTVDGPMLYTPSATLDAATLREIERVLPAGGTVYVLGGPEALAPPIEDQLRDAGYRPVRLWGTTRVETSIAVGDVVVQRYGDAPVVALARAFGPDTSAWADSVSGGGMAAAFGIPILLTHTEYLDDPVADALHRYGPEVTVLLGGPVALSPAVEEAAPQPVRVWGQDREGTAIAIAEQVWGRPYEHALVVDIWNGDGWEVGLAAAGVSSDLGAPILGVRNDRVGDTTAAWLGTCGTPPFNLWLIGSNEVIQPAVLDRLDGLMTCV